VAYVDDVAIILSAWTIENGLAVSPSNTELVLFTHRFKIPQLNPLILNNCNLSFSDQARYLTLVADKRLKWGLNNQERTKKETIALYSCKKAIGLGWGMSPRIVNYSVSQTNPTIWSTSVVDRCLIDSSLAKQAPLVYKCALKT